jgi:hypothetical protein
MDTKAAIVVAHAEVKGLALRAMRDQGYAFAVVLGDGEGGGRGYVYGKLPGQLGTTSKQ